LLIVRVPAEEVAVPPGPVAVATKVYSERWSKSPGGSSPVSTCTVQASPALVALRFGPPGDTWIATAVAPVAVTVIVAVPSHQDITLLAVGVPTVGSAGAVDVGCVGEVGGVAGGDVDDAGGGEWGLLRGEVGDDVGVVCGELGVECGEEVGLGCLGGFGLTTGVPEVLADTARTITVRGALARPATLTTRWWVPTVAVQSNDSSVSVPVCAVEEALRTKWPSTSSSALSVLDVPVECASTATVPIGSTLPVAGASSHTPGAAEETGTVGAIATAPTPTPTSPPTTASLAAIASAKAIGASG
jgi:hypothetical protein